MRIVIYRLDIIKEFDNIQYFNSMNGICLFFFLSFALHSLVKSNRQIQRENDSSYIHIS